MSRLSESEITDRSQAVPGWSRKGDAIEKVYTFPDFAGSMRFANRVAALAEEMDHHPDILVQYSRVTLTLSSHDVGGLSERDFRLAGRIDAA